MTENQNGPYIRVAQPEIRRHAKLQKLWARPEFLCRVRASESRNFLHVHRIRYPLFGKTTKEKSSEAKTNAIGQ
jgi:hypothetical protein